MADLCVRGFVGVTDATTEVRSLRVGSDLVVRLRLANEAIPETAQPDDMLSRADFTAMSYRVFRRVDDVDTLVEGYESVAITISDAIPAGTVRTWGKDGVGYNFRHKVPAECFAGNCSHTVEYFFTVDGVIYCHPVFVEVEGPVGDAFGTAGTGQVTGLPGAPGASAAPWTLLGEWQSDVTYEPGDAVSYDGGSYAALVANTNSIPPNANWFTIASPGTDGTDGDNGLDGLGYEFDITKAPYNAVDDGTDQSAAIQACVAAAAATGVPQIVYLPPGMTFVVEDVDDDPHETAADGPIRIEPGEADIHFLGYGATIKAGPNGVSTAMIRIFGSRCTVEGITFDADCDQTNDSAKRKAKGNSGVLIYSTHPDATAADGNDSKIINCKWINGYRGTASDPNGDDAQNQGCEGFGIVAGRRCEISRCIVNDSSWSGYFVSGEDNILGFNTADNFRGNGIRVNQGTTLTLIGNRLTSDRCHGRSGILIDAGSAAGSSARTELVNLIANFVYINPDGTGLDPQGNIDGAGVGLKVGSAGLVSVWGGRYVAGNATDNYALRLEDSLREFVAEGGAQFLPNGRFTPADNDESSVYQGLITSVANNGSGKCRFTLSGVGNPDSDEGLKVGKSLFIHGSSDSAYNREHIVTAKISDYVFDTDINFNTSTIGSLAYGRTGVDVARFRNCRFGGPTFGANGGNQDTAFLVDASCRVLEIDGCTLDQLAARTLSYNAISWLCQYDAGFESMRIVNNDFTFNTDAASSHVGRMINPDTAFNATSLTSSGKIISHNNRLKNIGAGGAVIANSAAANYNRQILFSTDGECRNRFVWTTPPNSGDNRTTFNTGDELLQQVSTQPGLHRWQCYAPGISGSVAPSWMLRDAPYKFFATADGTAVADFDAAEEVSATPATGIGSLQFGGLRALTIGEGFRLAAAGTYSTTGTPTLNFGASIGKSQIGNGASGSPVGTAAETGRVKIAEISSFTTPNNAAALRWQLELTALVRSISASGQVQVTGVLRYETAANTWTEKRIGPTIVTVATNNTAHNRKLDVWAAWGTKNAANSFICTRFENQPL